MNKPTTTQKILIMTTEHHSLRAEVVGWGGENPDLLAPGPIGNTRSSWWPEYPTPMHALAAGWRLLAPPVGLAGEWEWWFVREDTP